MLGGKPPATGPALDPLVLEAAKDVDLSLIDWALTMSPRERLRASTNAVRALARFGHASPEDR
jgi:hypothetical protein